MLFQASNTHLCLATLQTLAVLVATAAYAAPPEKTAALDTPAFLAAEHDVRHEFVQRYPLLDQFNAVSGSQAFKNRPAAELMKRLDKLPDDQKFIPAFAYVMGGKVAAHKKATTPPSYWQRQLAALMASLPHGDAMAKTYLNRNEAEAAKENNDAINQFALDNMQNFRELVTGYEIATGEEFDRASLIARVRYILAMFARAQGDISLPCPFSIYLLDIESAAGDDPETQSVPHEIIGRLLGKKSPDYLHFPGYSREQKSAALKHAYLHLLDDAQAVAAAPSSQALAQYLQFAALRLDSDTSDWHVGDDFNNLHTLPELIRDTFGDADLQKFNGKPEGADKDTDRVAAILLWTQFRLGSSGWLIG